MLAIGYSVHMHLLYYIWAVCTVHVVSVALCSALCTWFPWWAACTVQCTCGVCGTVQCTVYLVSMMTCLHCACGLCGTGGADWYYATRTQGDIEQASCGQGCKEKKTKWTKLIKSACTESTPQVLPSNKNDSTQSAQNTLCNTRTEQCYGTILSTSRFVWVNPEFIKKSVFCKRHSPVKLRKIRTRSLDSFRECFKPGCQGSHGLKSAR